MGHKEGFTLIETIIGIVVIGVVFMGLLATVTGVFTNAGRDEAVAVAISLAKGGVGGGTRLRFANIAD